MHEGYTLNYRKSIDHPLFKHPKIWHYFQYCIMRANWQTTTFIWNKQEVTLERGEFICGLTEDSKATGLSVRNIRTAREILNNLKMTVKVTGKSTSKYTVLKVCNYDTYNDQKGHADKVNDNQSDKQVTGKRQASDNIQECISIEKNEKKEKDLCDSSGKDAGKTAKEKKQIESDELFDECFETLWKVYPARTGKKRGKPEAKKLLLSLPKKDHGKIYQAVINYANDAEVKKGIGIRDAKRFFRNDFWREYLELSTTASGDNGNMPTYEEKLEYNSTRHRQARFKILNREGYIARANSDDEHWYIPDDTANVHELTDHRRELHKFRRARDLRHELTAEEKARWYKANPGQ